MRESVSHPKTDWWIRSPYLYPLETGFTSYTPMYWISILVVSYDMRGLRWGYSCYQPPHGS